MKKIILGSLVAMMAVTAANAEIASVKYVDDLVVVAEEVVAEENRDKVVPTIARTEVIIADSHDKIIAKDGEQVDDADVDSVVPTLARTENLINDTQSSLTGIIGDTSDFQPGESVMGFVDANTAAIAEIKHEENGILAVANKYTDDEISELSDSLTGTTGSLTTLTQTVTDLDGVVDTLNGDANTAGSVKKQIADAIADEVVRANDAYDAKGAAADALQAAKDYANANDADTIYNDTEVRDLISDAQDAADAAALVAGNAQVKSEALSIGGAEGAWVNLTEVTGYSATGTHSLVLKDGNIQWEAIRY